MQCMNLLGLLGCLTMFFEMKNKNKKKNYKKKKNKKGSILCNYVPECLEEFDRER